MNCRNCTLVVVRYFSSVSAIADCVVTKNILIFVFTQCILENDLVLIRNDDLWMRYIVVRHYISSSAALVERFKTIERVIGAACHINLNFSSHHSHLCFLLSSLNIFFVVELEELILLFCNFS